MNSFFVNVALDIRTNDGLDSTLLQPLQFNRADGSIVRAPIGSTTDGLSTPSILHAIPGYDSTGDDWFSGVIHDAGYRDFLEIYDAEYDRWNPAHFTQEQCDDLILEAMTTQGVGFLRRHTIYRALRMFGSFAFKQDRIDAAKIADQT